MFLNCFHLASHLEPICQFGGIVPINTATMAILGGVHLQLLTNTAQMLPVCLTVSVSLPVCLSLRSFQCIPLQPPSIKQKPCLFIWTQFEDHNFRLYQANWLSKMADRLVRVM